MKIAGDRGITILFDIRVILIYLMLCFAPFVVLGQLTGRYCHSYNGWGGKCITFHKNHKFEFEYSTDCGGSVGKGVYKKSGNNVILFFQCDTAEKNSRITSAIKESFPANSSSIEIDVTVYDKVSHEKLSYVFCSIQDLYLKTQEYFCTDINGHCNFKLDSSKKTAFLTISMVGYEPYRDTIRLNNNYKYTVYLAIAMFGVQTIDSGRIAFKIMHEKNGNISLMEAIPNNESEGEKYFRIKKNINRHKGGRKNKGKEDSL